MGFNDDWLLASARAMPAVPPVVALTPREHDVAARLRRGESNKEIARFLGLSDFTVRDLVSQMCKKLKCKNRTAVAAMATAWGILGSDELVSPSFAGRFLPEQGTNFSVAQGPSAHRASSVESSISCSLN